MSDTIQDPVQTLKGFRDFIGEQAEKRLWLTNIIRQVFMLYGFEPLETPTLEYASLLEGKYGDEAEKLIYSFEDRGGRKVALRYDQTVPTARIIAQYQNTLIFPYKRYQIQLVWRADKPQKGRYREFLQCDADIIGSSSPIADAEILAVYYAIYKACGLNSIKINYNDRQLLINAVKSITIPEEKVLSVIQTIDKIAKITEEELRNELSEKGISTEDGKKLLEQVRGAQPSEALKKICDEAMALGVPSDALVFEPTLARGLDYYTGLIFEGNIPEYGVGSVGGGGRYDTLIKSLVGVDKPAVGFGLGFDRTLEAAEQLGVIPEMNSSSVLVTIFSPELAQKSLEITSQLRNAEIGAECYPNESQKLDTQIKYALKRSVRFLIIIGPDEAKGETVVVKNLQKNEQKIISRAELISYVRTLVTERAS